jgi:hypothetical protein
VSARTPHDVGPQADLALSLQDHVRTAGGSLVHVPQAELLAVIEHLQTLRGEGVIEGEARAERALTDAREKLTAVIELVGKIEAHELPHTYAHRVLARDLRDALGLGDVRISHACAECPRG